MGEDIALPKGVEALAFDAGFLDGPVWRLSAEADLEEAVAAAMRCDVRLMVVRTGLDDRRPSGMGFRPVEILATYELPLEYSIEMPAEVFVATAADADAVEAIAKSVFHWDRWHADPNIPNKIADAFKGAWARNDVEGRADCVFVTRDETGIANGFNACLLKDRTAIVDLIGRSREARGRGLGTLLMRAAEAHYFGKADRIRVGTQEANSMSGRLYKALGYSEISRQTTWHWMPRQ